MSVRMPAAQGERDVNQIEIMARYEALYCQVKDTSKMGRGFPDLIVSIPTRAGRILDLVEVKTQDGRATPAQVTFHRDFYPFTIVRNADEVTAHVEAVRARFKR